MPGPASSTSKVSEQTSEVSGAETSEVFGVKDSEALETPEVYCEAPEI